MALEDILAAIAAETDRTVADVEASTRQRVEEIRREAEAGASAVEEERAAGRDAAATASAAAIVNRARLTARRGMDQAREDVFAVALARVAERLAALREDPDYAAIFAILLEECRTTLPAVSVARTDPRDREVCAGQCRAAGMAVETTLEAMGGLDAAADDQRLVHNTLDSRLSRAVPHLRRILRETVPAIADEGP